MRAREKIVYLLFLCMACMVSSCGDDGKEDWESEREEISQSRFSLSPPEWLIGTWQDGTGLITLQCTENNIIYGTDMASIDFVRYAEETSKFYEQDPSIGKVVLRDEFKGDSWYRAVLTFIQMGVESEIFVKVEKLSSTEIEVSTEDYSSLTTKFTKIR